MPADYRVILPLIVGDNKREEVLEVVVDKEVAAAEADEIIMVPTDGAEAVVVVEADVTKEGVFDIMIGTHQKPENRKYECETVAKKNGVADMDIGLGIQALTQPKSAQCVRKTQTSQKRN
jgi:hypothetical protein